MNVFRNTAHLPAFRNAVMTIGSFDGVHLGHQQILAKINKLARETGGESVVVTFHPHPRSVIYPKDESLKLLTTTEEKISLFEQFGIDNVVIAPFTVEFSQMTAEEYVERFLIGLFKPKIIVIGYDHKFGANRLGDINYLRWYCLQKGITVVEIERQEVDAIAVSSSKIREFLKKGSVSEAGRLLGHPFSLTGEIVQGHQIGGKLGFPTANLHLPEKLKLIPPRGIYAALAEYNGKAYQAMLYIGNRPTIGEHLKDSIEVNIFDFHENIYGKTIRIQLVDFIRNDAKFESLDELREQLKKDKIRSFNILEAFAKSSQKVTETPSAGIVILNYNGKGFLQKFLPSVLATSYPNTNIWVADNGSTDDSAAFLKSHFPNVGLIQLDKNYGFAEGYNQALQKLENDVDYFVLLNSDVEITPDWLNPLIALMENDRTVAACQPKILSYAEKNRFEYAGAGGGWLDWLGYPFCRGRVLSETETDEGQYDDAAEVFWATGAAMVIRSKLFHRIGGFDGDYFAHMEEIDLCWRLKRAAFKIMVEPKSVVYHVGGGTLSYKTPRKTYLNFRNSLFTIFKNEKLAKVAWLLPFRLILDGAAALLFAAEGNFEHIKSILFAHLHFYKSVFSLIEKRQGAAKLIAENRISATPNRAGIFNGSIAWHFFVLKNRTFRKINPDEINS